MPPHDPADAAEGPSGRHPRLAEPALLAVALLLGVGGAVIGMQIITTLGVTPNTSIVGVMVAILISRIPLRVFRGFRSVHRQNLIQTTISSATFGAANSLLVPVGVPVILGRSDLVLPMLLGASAGMLIDLAMLYWLFDSRLFPGDAPWPIGVASGEAILAADRGGRRAGLLGLGALAGAGGSSGVLGALPATVGVASLPMAALGLAFLGNVWALGMFGVGLLVRGYGASLGGIDFDAALIPHGMMIGAGLVALGQAVAAARGPGRAEGEGRDDDGAVAPDERPGSTADGAARTRTPGQARAGIVGGLILYLAAGGALAALGGLWTGMGAGSLALWIVFAAVACVAAEFIVGLSAMQAGWFPAFATALVFLLIGMAAGFPPEASALLVGFVASGGPAFADGGYDFKTGWYLRGRGRRPAFEREGRRQQLVAAVAGLLTALAVVALFRDVFFGTGRFPPIVEVYAAAIDAGLGSGEARALFGWALPGAALQWVGGARRQLGILFATGLLITNPLAGWAVLVGLLIRRFWSGGSGDLEDEPATVFAGGLIAGDALWGFGSALF